MMEPAIAKDESNQELKSLTRKGRGAQQRWITTKAQLCVGQVWAYVRLNKESLDSERACAHITKALDETCQELSTKCKFLGGQLSEYRYKAGEYDRVVVAATKLEEEHDKLVKETASLKAKLESKNGHKRPTKTGASVALRKGPSGREV